MMKKMKKILKVYIIAEDMKSLKDYRWMNIVQKVHPR